MDEGDDIVDKPLNAIKPIRADTVHKICSGQVVFSLAVAVKELVENSLDAGATRIEIRLKNYGIDLIEVVDNGTGVTEDNFSALTLKYHTSKLSDYSDLLGVSSFGFRGEALSSLCSLANVTITTKHQSAEYATKIEYDHNGYILNKTPCSRQVGTTVMLRNLFFSLPVRQKEFQKNAKREFNKMTNLLYAYCLISVGVNITCSNQTNSNSKSLVVATQGSMSYEDNIACIFGPKQLQNLLEIKNNYIPSIKENIFKGLSGEIQTEENVTIEETEIDLSEDSNDADNADKISQNSIILNSQDTISSSQKSKGHVNAAPPVELTGFISSCAHGCGRSSADRQFYYINSRPCEPNKIMKVINEIYRQFNPHQYAFVFLNITLDRTFVDVNVTPDKRKLFLAKEKAILDVIKGSILKLFENIPKIVKVESLNCLNTTVINADVDTPRVFNSFLQQFSKKLDKVAHCASSFEKKPELKRKANTLLDYSISKTKRINIDEITSEEQVGLSDSNENYRNIENIKKEFDETDKSVNSHTISVSNNDDNLVMNNEIKDVMYLEYTDELPNTQIRNLSDVITEKSNTIYCKTKNTPRKSNIADVEKNKRSKVMTDKEELGKYNRRSLTMKTSMDQIVKLVDIYKNRNKRCKPDKIKFKSEINPVFNKKCEEELCREITKESFTSMVVIGQFNLGFIITRLEDDLFVIDQHATDEIYNFEMLQRTTELTSQKLVIPQQLELSGVNEQILIDNIDIFKKNGFTFEIDENGLPTKRVKLLTIPMSKNWIFGKDDIEELLFMLRQSHIISEELRVRCQPGKLDKTVLVDRTGRKNIKDYDGKKENQSEHCRPSRVRAMFASRACRKSVMIGTALSKSDMKTLVNHMAEIDKPWNCPHGRPTIRHLVNLSMVYTE